jgi:sugar phosphate isomerase/epimerase
MRIGVYSDSLPRLDRRALFAWCAERGVTDVELGVGAWGPWPRPHLDLAKIGERVERDRLAGELREHGLRLAAVNAAGNLLHPDRAKRSDAQARLRAAVDLAVALGVKRVVTMSGCPAGPGGGSLTYSRAGPRPATTSGCSPGSSSTRSARSGVRPASGWRRRRLR